ncbi:DUF4232 domain-containing protein [Streptomyces bambusae]|uniref:DUF4232 domain-containing protein n=1 Tax=Streptomyces bambusae TaxID=1550616 RepID=UPI001CFC5C8D|nr:DUF4232 domain-containing protein [Streptomyces bambusae]MCB5167722.1 DUF4232 domain-containing protein [Streptomyces bambusae]
MQYAAGVRRTAAVIAAATAAVALMTGCTPSGDDGAAGTPTAPSAPAGTTGGAATGGSGGSTGGSTTGDSTTGGSTGGTTGGSTGGTTGGSTGGTTGGSTGGSATGGTTGGTGGGSGLKPKPCTAPDLKVSEATQAAVRPPGTGTGAAVVSVANTSAKVCTVRGFPTVAGAGNGSPDKNVPLAVTWSGTAKTVALAPGMKAWTKLTFVPVLGEADGYCTSGATPATYPTIVLGVPGAGGHQTALDDGVFALCDGKVTVTAFSYVKPA